MLKWQSVVGDYLGTGTWTEVGDTHLFEIMFSCHEIRISWNFGSSYQSFIYIWIKSIVVHF